MQLAGVCGLVLACSCFVTATPHGYGAKGGAGAIAKADASAAAGAYSGLGALPVGVPIGAGFSGSFTKSSSSSSSSSSASSSSSSFSFSGSGYPGVGGGCATGVCPNSGVDKNAYSSGQNGGAISGNNDLNHGYTNTAGANSGAAAQAGALAGSQLHFGSNNNPSCTGNNCFEKVEDCKGSNCNGAGAGGVQTPGKKCETGQCFPALPTQPSSFDTTDDKNNCVSGQCDSPSGTAPIPTNVNSNVDKDNYYPSKCQSGKCETTTPPRCTGGQCSPTSSLPNAPSAIEPNRNPHSGGPIKDTTSSYSPDTPTSYGYNNKPNSESQGTTSTDYNPHKCTSGQCKPSPTEGSTQKISENDDIAINSQKNFNSNSNNKNENSDYEKGIGNSKGPSNCAYGNCATSPASNAPVIYPGSHPQSSLNIHVDTSKCNSPDCKTDVYNHAAAAGGASASAFNKPATYLTTPVQGPSCTSPNCKSTSFNPDYHTPGTTVPVSVSQPVNPYDIKKPYDCASGNCGNNQPNSYFTSTNINSPNPTLPNSDNGAFGYKCTSPNCASIPQHPSHQGPNSYNAAQPAATVLNNIPSYKPSTPAQGQFPPTNNNPTNNQFNNNYPKGTSASFTPAIATNIPFYPNQPNQPQNHSPEPNYANQIKPNEPKTPNNEEPFPPFVPLSPSRPQSCGANGCAGVPATKPNYGINTVPTQSNFVHGAPVSPSSPSYQSAAPSIPTATGVHSFPATSNINKPAQDKPLYAGGFGGPPGLLKPNDYSVPSAIPASSKPAAGELPSTPCSTGNCNSPLNHGQIHNGNSNAIPATAQNTAICTTGKCGSQIASGTNIFNGAGAHASAGAAASANSIVYTGGFGGPPGFLKPYDGGNAKGQLASLTGKGAGLSSGFSGHSANSVNSQYSNGAGSIAQAFAAAGASAGAFSGQPGHYNHNNGGNLNKSGAGCSGGCSPSGTGTTIGGLNAHYDAGLAGLSAAKAGAISGANAGAFNSQPSHYSHNNGGNVIKSSVGCDGGCSPSTGTNSGGLNAHYDAGLAGLSAAKAGAISGANAGAFGFGGSFASSSASAHASAGAAVKGYGRR